MHNPQPMHRASLDAPHWQMACEEQQLNAMAPAERSQHVGNFIYPHIAGLIGEASAPKVTGMILELPVAELSLIMKGYEHLKAAVDQAVAVLPADMKPPPQSPVPAISPTSVLESDRWADADDMEEDGELPPVCELFGKEEERRRTSKEAVESMEEDTAAESAFRVEWDAAAWTAEPDASKVVTFISERLEEPQVRIPRAVVDFLGNGVALDLLARTERIQAEGGMLVEETGKPRTSGGIFFKLLKDATNLPREAQESALLRIKTEGKKVKPSQKGRVPSSPRTPTGPALGDFVVTDRRRR